MDDSVDQPRADRWRALCLSLAPPNYDRALWYCHHERAPTTLDDMNAAFEDTATGNERALKYVAKYMALRMTT